MAQTQPVLTGPYLRCPGLFLRDARRRGYPFTHRLVQIDTNIRGCETGFEAFSRPQWKGSRGTITSCGWQLYRAVENKKRLYCRWRSVRHNSCLWLAAFLVLAKETSRDAFPSHRHTARNIFTGLTRPHLFCSTPVAHWACSDLKNTTTITHTCSCLDTLTVSQPPLSPRELLHAAAVKGTGAIVVMVFRYFFFFFKLYELDLIQNLQFLAKLETFSK